MRMPAFWCHLASEKALKGLATARGIPLRKTHKLIEILGALPTEDYAAFHVEDLHLLDPWQAAGRYPGDVSDHGPQARGAACCSREHGRHCGEPRGTAALMPGPHDEPSFEDAIEGSLIDHGGWTKGTAYLYCRAIEVR